MKPLQRMLTGALLFTAFSVYATALVYYNPKEVFALPHGADLSHAALVVTGTTVNCQEGSLIVYGNGISVVAQGMPGSVKCPEKASETTMKVHGLERKPDFKAIWGTYEWHR